jgi:hypothetical protein
MVFTIVYFLVDEKIKLKVLACSLKLLTNFENPSSDTLQMHKSGDLTLKMHTGSRLCMVL